MRWIRFIFLILLASSCLAMTGCWFIYRPDIRQGNTLTLRQVASIHSGMTSQEVVALLGNPVLENVFAPNQMIYVYTIQPGHGEYQAEQLRIYFQNGVVSHYTSNVRVLPT